MQRIIAMLLFAVFLLGPSAPALAALQPLEPMACHRPVETGRAPSPAASPEPTPSVMAHCHDMATPPARAAQTPPSPEPTFSPNNCCTDHDCCRRHDRTQWAYLAPIPSLHPVAAATTRVALASAPAHTAVPSDDHSGRAPPTL
jgi:hypothetical protein